MACSNTSPTTTIPTRKARCVFDCCASPRPLKHFTVVQLRALSISAQRSAKRRHAARGIDSRETTARPPPRPPSAAPSILHRAVDIRPQRPSGQRSSPCARNS
eukprot:scaffold174344_cov32-Tisochrysis_lutea.AAC.3